MLISELSEEKKRAIYAIEDGDNIFVTGSAGTGKSFLLQYIKQNYSGSGLVVTASTGIAAVNIGGQTIHSWSAIGLANKPAREIIANLFSPKLSKIRRRIKLARILAIDEISMISAATFDLLNEVLKAVRQNEKPFGGLQIILFGDFFQLPPIEKPDQDSQYCFSSKAWEELNLKNFILQKSYRQKDEDFVRVLENIRYGKISESDVKILSSRIIKDKTSVVPRSTILVTHNFQMNQINQYELNKIPELTQVFNAEFFGDEKKFDFLTKNCIANPNLELKTNAQVMMIKNTYQKEGIINGSLGVIKDFSEKKNYPVVEFQNGKILTIGKEEWVIEKFDNEKNKMIVEAGMRQIPLILSWAITIHKSQGMTLDKIRCSLGRAFAYGQIYVALSRVKNLDGLYIEDLALDKITTNKQVSDFYSKLE
jgi:ATP-dependent DNA helicase PIF1